MEHIGEILKQIRKTSSANRNTDTWFAAEPEPASKSANCPLCKEAGFVHPLLPNGKADYSRVVPCQCAQQPNDLQRQSNLGPLAKLTFENMNPDGTSENPVRRAQFRRAYEAAANFAERPDGWLVLVGPSGSGKTHLAAAIANRCLAGGSPVLYITAPDLLDYLRSTFNPNSEVPYDEFFEQVRTAPLLILDDLGAQSSTPWAKEKLEQLLTYRYSSRLPTVVISILPVDDLDERIRTRLLAAGVYEVAPFDDSAFSKAFFGWQPHFIRQKDMTFESFDWKRTNLPVEQRENLERAFNLAQEFAAAPEGWLVLQGDNGCGKTHLAAAIVNYRYQLNQPALFIVVADFLDHLRATFNPDSKISYDKLFESVKNAPLLALDDFGKQTTTAWAQEKLFQVINHRYNAKLPTVITTNASTDELDGAIMSRFIDPKMSVLFHITAPDYWAGRHSQKKPQRRN